MLVLGVVYYTLELTTEFIKFIYKTFIYFFNFLSILPPLTGRGMTDVNYYDYRSSRCQQLKVIVSIGFIPPYFLLTESIQVNKYGVQYVLCLSWLPKSSKISFLYSVKGRWT